MGSRDQDYSLAFAKIEKQQRVRLSNQAIPNKIKLSKDYTKKYNSTNIAQIKVKDLPQ